MSYGVDQISSRIDDMQSEVYPIRLISKVAVGGGKTVGVDASLGIFFPNKPQTAVV